ncbi:MAG: SDR family oxidoreductase [Candidatus Caenarcaniphilales bacterium]|jgi:dTDP-glucose 4,6-dehydratase|nr:SDR family oxidoreductase [Candidatus Caenarcaniphilales bacterium]
MRILITGGAGFIGSHLSEKLLKAGNEIIVIDNLVTGSLENIAHLDNHPNFTFINHNVSEYISIDGDLDWVMHFASPASPVDFEKLAIPILKVGSLGTHNALGLAREKNAKFFLASTSEVYGDPEVHPQPETYFGNVNPIGPRGVYDESKRFAEAITMAYHHKHKIDTRIVRIFNTFGPRMRADDGRVVCSFVSQALLNKPITVFGDGSQTRSFQYVDDLVDGICKMMEVEFNQPINIGNPVEFTINQLAQMVIKLLDSKSTIEYLPLPQDDPKRRRPDITRATTLLNWAPKYSLEDGLKQSLDYFRQIALSST